MGRQDHLFAPENTGEDLTRKPVHSSSIRSIGYDPDNEILEIELRNGGIYQYFKVPAAKYDDLTKASSIGRYYTVYIKNAFQFRKVK